MNLRRFTQSDNKRINLYELVFLAVMAALMVVSQVALSALPNIELVTLFVILTAHRFGIRALYPIYAFVIVEGLIYGFHIWWIVYIYIWAVLAIIVCAVRKNSNAIVYTIIAAVYGLLFGTLSSLPYFITGGIGGGVAYIISGLTFDLLHLLGNTVSVAFLFAPLNAVLNKYKIGNEISAR